ncbi:MAG: protein-disulfide reductase DsbD [Chlorobiaceae bacterium]
MKLFFYRRLASILCVFITLFFSVSSVFGNDFLNPDQAFKLKADLSNNRTIVLHWKIAKGYKLYRDRVKISADGGTTQLKFPVLPKGIVFVDPSTNEKLEIYHDNLLVNVPIRNADGVFKLNVEYQGCAEDGLCYPPITQNFKVDPSKLGVLLPLTAGDPQLVKTLTSPSSSNQAQAKKVNNDFSGVKETLEGRNLWVTGLKFLLFGLLLSFTPCVLPMIPILSSIIVGEGDVSRRRSFLMALAYCLGMALVYTSLGVAAGLAGEGLAGALQKPWVLALFALLLVVLSLSMFDVYQLQMPAALQTKLNKTSGKLKGGSFVGVFFMGALSALIVGPCVAAPLAGTLVYISQTRDVVIGGLALFSMASGMSVPLLLVGLSAGSLLPRAGAWMIGVKYFFGLLLIAVAIWMVSPVLPIEIVMVLWGAFTILCSVFLGIFDKMPENSTIAIKFGKTLGFVLFIIGVLELVGAASGSTNVFEPLAQIRSAVSTELVKEPKSGFTRIHSVEELDLALKSAKKPIMLDFYANWCVACKEMDQFTFHDPNVIAQLHKLTLLQVDVSANNAADKALMKRFGLFGPPGIIFFDVSGKEISDSRVIGVIDAEAFSNHIRKYVTGS